MNMNKKVFKMKKIKKCLVPVWMTVLCLAIIVCAGCGQKPYAENSSTQEVSVKAENSENTSADQIEDQKKISNAETTQEAAGQGSDSTEKIKVSEAEPVCIAVIDTGFSSRAIPQENIVAGKNYLNDQETTRDTSDGAEDTLGSGGNTSGKAKDTSDSVGKAIDKTEDTYGHGTAVASFILQYAPEVQLVPLVSSVYEDGRIRQVDADTLAQILRDAVDIYGCQVINISAGLKEDNGTLKAAVEYVQKCGALIVASAGNDYVENGSVKYYPAAYDSVLAVGALNADETEIADFSQRGNWVDIYVPGQNISVKTLSGAVKTGDGTSYAAARVSGEAAVLWKSHPDMTEQQIRETLTQTWSPE